ncbi:MAG: hypothetical protein U0235_21215 [Polyangiaceae bacterium]
MPRRRAARADHGPRRLERRPGWGPQQIIPTGPLAAPYELRAAPSRRRPGTLMRSCYSQSEIDGINARNAGAGAPPAPGDAQQYSQYSELGPNNELDAAYRDAHQYDQYSELGPNNELDAAYRDAHQYDQYSELGPNNELDAAYRDAHPVRSVQRAGSEQRAGHGVPRRAPVRSVQRVRSEQRAPLQQRQRELGRRRRHQLGIQRRRFWRGRGRRRFRQSPDEDSLASFTVRASSAIDVKLERGTARSVSEEGPYDLEY